MVYYTATGATLFLQNRQIYGRGLIELVIWKLPAIDQTLPNKLKYRLVHIVNGERVLGYNNGRGKGEHKQIGGQELPYTITTVQKLFGSSGKFVGKKRKGIVQDLRVSKFGFT